MNPFPYAHATHPQWRMAAALVLAQLRAQLALPGAARSPSLGLLYITDACAEDAAAILEHLSAELPEVRDWVGTVGVGIAATNAEYFDEPALAVMLCDLAPEQYRVFSGVAPLPPGGQVPGADGFEAHTALVHADGQTPDLPGLLAEMAERTRGGYLFGGLSSSRSTSPQFAYSRAIRSRGQGAASGVFQGGLSGVAFAPGVGLTSRVTQGAQPLDRERSITEVDGHLVLSLDGEPALDVLLDTLQLSLESAPQATVMRLRSVLVGLSEPQPVQRQHIDAARRGQFGPQVRVRHLVGLDPARRGIAIAESVPVGTRLAFCERHAQAARADLVRLCAELREEVESLPELADGAGGAAPEGDDSPAPQALETTPARRMVGAVYVSCAGRGGPHFGSPSAELQTVRRALGDVPLVGFFAGGEIAHQQLYGYTGVLTVFTAAAD